MKIDPAEQRTGAKHAEETDGGVETESETADAGATDDGAGNETADAGATDDGAENGSALTDAEPLTITLPDGSESVSEAILSHRRMLTNPSDHGLVSSEEAEEVRETVDRLAEEVPEELRGKMTELEASVDELAAGVDRQQQQIQELRATVASLAEILGASVEFRSFGDEQ